MLLLEVIYITISEIPIIALIIMISQRILGEFLAVPLYLGYGLGPGPKVLDTVASQNGDFPKSSCHTV